jgi:hypothetical protein
MRRETSGKRHLLIVLCGAVMIFVLNSCRGLSEDRAIELVRLNYRQQNTMHGAGNWLLDTVEIHEISAIKDDSVTAYRVLAYTRGLYSLPVIEDAPRGFTEQFFDTVQFTARKANKIWMADDWVIIGSRHE